MSRRDQRLHLSLDEIDALSPFYIWTDRDGRIQGHGRTFNYLFDKQVLTGAPIASHFSFVRPKIEGPQKLDRSVQRVKLATCAPEGEVNFGFSGLVLRLDDPPGYLFMLTPGMEVQKLIELYDLKAGDLSAVDGSTDLLVLLQAQKQMMFDAMDNAARVDAARKEAEARANSDPLTGLLNRRGLTSRLDGILHAGDTMPCGLIHIDLDRFKTINDTHGHAAGDAILIHVAKALSSTVFEPSFAGRLGGDEFVVVVPGEARTAGLVEMSERLNDLLSTPMSWNGLKLKTGATFGITAVTDETKVTLDDLLHQADMALLEGKRKGRGRISVYDQRVMRHKRSLRAVAAELPAALARGEFLPVYHPQFQLESGHLAGVEVLVRWNHPKRGLLSPAQFLESAEYSNIMNDIDASIRAMALSDLAGWRQAGLSVPRISFNMSEGVLGGDQLEQELVWQATDYGIPHEDITLEVLESIFMDRAGQELKERALELNGIGFRLALDDFGTGHASLSSLITLPIREVKIDRSFVHGISASNRLRALTETLCRMGQNLGLEIVAEGVEEESDLHHLSEFGVHTVQGFLLAKPMRSSVLVEWLSNRNKGATAQPNVSKRVTG